MTTVDTTAAERSAAPRAAISQNNARLQEALSRGDAAAIAAMYTEDAQLMPPNGAAARGPVEIRAFWEGGMKAGVKRLRIETQELETNGEVAVETGHYQMVMQPAGGAEVTDEGKYLVVWHRQTDGAWKLHRDIFNSNLPLPSVH
jgi:uncharacterized protein (TIGR02246 family)